MGKKVLLCIWDNGFREGWQAAGHVEGLGPDSVTTCLPTPSGDEEQDEAKRLVVESGGLEPCRCSRPARDAAPTIAPTIF